jgi:uracil-DNA glycosylase family 4
LGALSFASQRRGGGQGPGVTEAERRAALEAIATEVRDCRRCRLHEGRTKAVPGEGHPSTEVVFVGEGPGFNEDRLGRPFVGRAGDLLVRLLGSIGWRRDEVFITNVVKCRPPENRDPEPDEIAACAPYLKRQLEVLDPALIVTLGRHSMGRFMPGARISQVHGTVRAAEAATGAADAMVLAMYHPAAALRSTEVERQSYDDMGRVPDALQGSRRRRDERRAAAAGLPAAISPPLLSGPETIVVEAPSGESAPSDRAGDAPVELVDAAVAVASRLEAREPASSNHPGDIRVAASEPEAPSEPRAAAEVRTPTDAETTDPSDQLPLF